MKLIIGLGNPGAKYNNTRHNIGFMIIDYIQGKIKNNNSRKYYDSVIYEDDENGEMVVFAKPQTFMNLSGNAVSSLVKKYNIDLKDLLVIHDDLDIPFGKIRLRAFGGSAGHKGLISIISVLGTEKFCRLRVGIGKPSQKKDTSDYVLGKIKKSEFEEMQNIISRASNAVFSFVEDGLNKAMNKFN